MSCTTIIALWEVRFFNLISRAVQNRTSRLTFDITGLCRVLCEQLVFFFVAGPIRLTPGLIENGRIFLKH